MTSKSCSSWTRVFAVVGDHFVEGDIFQNGAHCPIAKTFFHAKIQAFGQVETVICCLTVEHVWKSQVANRPKSK